MVAVMRLRCSANRHQILEEAAAAACQTQAPPSWPVMRLQLSTVELLWE